MYKHYDLVVIGTGAANIVVDAAVRQGLHIAIVEKGKFGGYLPQPRLYSHQDSGNGRQLRP